MASPGVCINLVNGTSTRLPTNAYLVVHYLHRRAIQEPVPCDFITNVDILQHNPWDIVPGKYFFDPHRLTPIRYINPKLCQLLQLI